MNKWYSKYFLKNTVVEKVYFDHASATPVLEIAKKKYLGIIENSFANAASIHAQGEVAKDILQDARQKVGKFLHTKSGNIFFASSTTEANNIFIKGLVIGEILKTEEERSGGAKGTSAAAPAHIIYSTSDHSSITEVVENLKKIYKSKIAITNIVPNKIGLLKVESILESLKENTKLICFSYVHSELGTVQEVRKIVLGVREKWEIMFKNKNYPKIFIDATQAAKTENMDLSTLLVDGLSFGGSKLGSVGGCAVLYVNPNTKLEKIISGGGQEVGVRSGTENLPAICALSEVLIYLQLPDTRCLGEKISILRNYAIEKLRENFTESELQIFGDTKYKYNNFFEHSAPHILLLSLKNMLGEEICLRLDAKGISVSPATACSLLENSGSNFLRSIGEPVLAKETIRISFSQTNTKKEIDYFVKILKDIKNKFL